MACCNGKRLGAGEVCCGGQQVCFTGQFCCMSGPGFKRQPKCETEDSRQLLTCPESQGARQGTCYKKNPNTTYSDRAVVVLKVRACC
jgi:hypothetical protein